MLNSNFSVTQKINIVFKLVIGWLILITRLLQQYIVSTFNWIFNRDSIIKHVESFEKKIYSQNGEDGILQLIFYKINTTNKFFVEFGVGTGKECNTQLLRKKNWNGVWMDSQHQSSLIKKEFITAENINQLFNKHQVPKSFDLLSIDIDSNDLWIWKAIKNYQPRVVVIEYNSSVPPSLSKVIKYDPHASWDKTNYFGASLLALTKLGQEKSYTLVGCDSTGTNAFFVLSQLVKNNFLSQSVRQLYRPPCFGKRVGGRKIGHPPSKRKMIDY